MQGEADGHRACGNREPGLLQHVPPEVVAEQVEEQGGEGKHRPECAEEGGGEDQLNGELPGGVEMAAVGGEQAALGQAIDEANMGDE